MTIKRMAEEISKVIHDIDKGKMTPWAGVLAIRELKLREGSEKLKKGLRQAIAKQKDDPGGKTSLQRICKVLLSTRYQNYKAKRALESTRSAPPPS